MTMTIPSANLVPMGKTRYFDFNEDGQKYGSRGFNGCLGVLIVGNGGAIIGHYTPGDRDINDTMDLMDGEQGPAYNPDAACVAILNYFSYNYDSFQYKIKTHLYISAERRSEIRYRAMVNRLSAIVAEVTGKKPKIHEYRQRTALNGEASFYVRFKSEIRGTRTRFKY